MSEALLKENTPQEQIPESGARAVDSKAKSEAIKAKLAEISSRVKNNRKVAEERKPAQRTNQLINAEFEREMAKARAASQMKSLPVESIASSKLEEKGKITDESMQLQLEKSAEKYMQGFSERTTPVVTNETSPLPMIPVIDKNNIVAENGNNVSSISSAISSRVKSLLEWGKKTSKKAGLLAAAAAIAIAAACTPKAQFGGPGSTNAAPLNTEADAGVSDFANTTSAGVGGGGGGAVETSSNTTSGGAVDAGIGGSDRAEDLGPLQKEVLDQLLKKTADAAAAEALLKANCKPNAKDVVPVNPSNAPSKVPAITPKGGPSQAPKLSSIPKSKGNVDVHVVCDKGYDGRVVVNDQGVVVDVKCVNADGADLPKPQPQAKSETQATSQFPDGVTSLIAQVVEADPNALSLNDRKIRDHKVSMPVLNNLGVSLKALTVAYQENPRQGEGNKNIAIGAPEENPLYKTLNSLIKQIQEAKTVDELEDLESEMMPQVEQAKAFTANVIKYQQTRAGQLQNKHRENIQRLGLRGVFQRAGILDSDASGLARAGTDTVSAGTSKTITYRQVLDKITGEQPLSYAEMLAYSAKVDKAVILIDANNRNQLVQTPAQVSVPFDLKLEPVTK